MAEKSAYLYQDEITLDEGAAKKNLTPDIAPALEQVLKALKTLEHWKAEAIHGVINDSAEALQLKLGKIAQPIRVAVTGNTVSPPLDITLELLGQARTVRRLEEAIRACAQ
jgi:glutamyl-tRNA synthetase